MFGGALGFHYLCAAEPCNAEIIHLARLASVKTVEGVLHDLIGRRWITPVRLAQTTY